MDADQNVNKIVTIIAAISFAIFKAFEDIVDFSLKHKLYKLKW